MADSTFDPYALSPQAIEEPPATLWKALGRIGPGLILAGSIVGTGELIATTNLGARVGFALLWLVIVSCFIKVFVQIELGRHAISSGETTLITLRKLPVIGIVLVWWWLFMMLLTVTQLGAMVGGVGQALQMAMPGLSPRLADAVAPISVDLAYFLHGMPVFPWAVLTALAAIALLVSGSYLVVEKSTTTFVVLFTLMTVVCVGILPWTPYAIPWEKVAEGLSFQIPGQAAALAAIAMFGITGVGATELFVYPYWCIEKGYARFTGPRSDDPGWTARARGWLRVMKLDAWSSMVVYTVATLAFYFLGAAVLHEVTGGKGLPRGDRMVPALAEMYAPAMGKDLAIMFFVIGGFAVLFSTLFVATASHSRMLTDFLQLNHFIRVRGYHDRLWWIRLLCVCYPIAALALYMGIGEPTTMVLIGATVQAATLPMIAAAALFLRYRRTDPRLRPTLWWDFFLWLSVLGMTAIAIKSFYDFAQSIRN